MTNLFRITGAEFYNIRLSHGVDIIKKVVWYIVDDRNGSFSERKKKSHFVFRLTISIDLYGLAVFRKDYKLKADEPC